MALAAFVYLLMYFVAASCDLWTTALAVRQAGAIEGNAFVTDHHTYMPARAWVINLAGALIMAACVGFATNHAESAETQCLLRPIASFRKMYLNPWSKGAIGVSPLHLLSMALAFVVLQLLAAGNNLMIHFYGFAPIGAPIELLAQHIAPVAAFGIVIVPLFCVLAIVISPIAARILSSWQGANDAGTERSRQIHA